MVINVTRVIHNFIDIFLLTFFSDLYPSIIIKAQK